MYTSNSEVASAEPDSNEQGAKLGVFRRTFQAFRYRDFRLMWTGSFTSTTGTWMQQVAESWLVLDLTGSAFYLGLVSFLGNLPILLFSLIGGVVADRVDRRKLLIASQIVQMSCAFILTGLVLFSLVEVWHILVLVFISGTGQSFGGPAYQALIPGLVKREDMPNAIALNSIQFNLARVIGPLLAAAAMATVGAVLCFALNGLSFLAVIITLYLIHATFVPTKTQDSVLEGMKKGFSYMKKKGSLWQLSILGFISTFCGIPLLTLLPIFARDVFHMGATGYANMMAISGAGAITGALLYAGMSKNRALGRLTLKVQFAFAVLIAVFAYSRNLALSYVTLFLAGICLITLFAAVTSLVQMNVVEEMRGRVMSIFMFAFRGGMPLGGLIIGYLAAELNPTVALAIGSAILGLTAICFYALSASVKKL